jgi:hypothetical protein
LKTGLNIDLPVFLLSLRIPLETLGILVNPIPNCKSKRIAMSATWSGGGLNVDHPMATTYGPLGRTINPLQPYNPSSYSAFAQLADLPFTLFDSDMPFNARTFQVQGPFGWGLTLSTMVPGALSLAFAGRARSEPPANTNNDMDVDTDRPLTRSQSEYHFDIPMDHPVSVSAGTSMYLSHPLQFPTLQDLGLSQQSSQSVPTPSQRLTSQPQTNPPPTSDGDAEEGTDEDAEAERTERNRRSPSLAPTELETPEHEDVLKDLQRRGIKVKDFAFLPRQPNVKPAFEIFDQFRGMVEYDYRLGQKPRDKPISGKTLRRLISIGWLKEAEVRKTVAQMDLDELEKHDRTLPLHPWKSYSWTDPPTKEQRKLLLELYAISILTSDRYANRAASERAAEAEDEKDRIVTLAALDLKAKEEWEEDGCVGDPPVPKMQPGLDFVPDPAVVRERREQYGKRKKATDELEEEVPRPDGKKRKITRNEEVIRPNAVAGPSNYAPAVPIHVPCKQFPAKRLSGAEFVNRYTGGPPRFGQAAPPLGRQATPLTDGQVTPPATPPPPPFEEDEEAYEGEPRNSLRRVRIRQKKAHALSRTLTYRQI